MYSNFRAKNIFYRLWFSVERHFKALVFDCSSCGQCLLRTTALTCPMRCPKGMRIGPCGGSMDAKCEVFRDRPCYWALIIKRQGRLGYFRKKMAHNQPPVDWSLWNTSSWLNLFSKQVNTDGHALSEHPNVDGKSEVSSQKSETQG